MYRLNSDNNILHFHNYILNIVKQYFNGIVKVVMNKESQYKEH